MQKCILYQRESLFYIESRGEDKVYLIQDGELAVMFIYGNQWRAFLRDGVQEVESRHAKRILRRINKLCHTNFEYDAGERAIFRVWKTDNQLCALLIDRDAKFDYLPVRDANPDCWLIDAHGVMFAANYQKVMRDSRAATPAQYERMKWALEHLSEYPIRLNPVARLIPRASGSAVLA